MESTEKMEAFRNNGEIIVGNTGNLVAVKALCSLNHLCAFAAKINALERFEPGDEVRISITVDNQSGREYAYKDRTIMVSTKDLKVTIPASLSSSRFLFTQST